jgi:hypothetical protein
MAKAPPPGGAFALGAGETSESGLSSDTCTEGVSARDRRPLAFLELGRGSVLGAGETGFPPSPLPHSGVWESLGSSNSDGRSESGLASDTCN